MITIIRGDTSPVYKFCLKYKTGEKKGEVITEPVKEVYFTVKRDCCDSDVVIQKKLSDGSITFNSDDCYYRFQISSDDTCSLKYGEYGFDIAIKDNENNKYTPLNAGKLVIQKHFTHKQNE